MGFQTFFSTFPPQSGNTPNPLQQMMQSFFGQPMSGNNTYAFSTSFSHHPRFANNDPMSNIFNMLNQMSTYTTTFSTLIFKCHQTHFLNRRAIPELRIQPKLSLILRRNTELSTLNSFLALPSKLPSPLEMTRNFC